MWTELVPMSIAAIRMSYSEGEDNARGCGDCVMSGASELVVRHGFATLRRALPGARHGHPEAIHRARVATRRVREALPVSASAATARKIGRRVRRLTRALGPVRELDVALQMLHEFAAAGEVSDGAKECLGQALHRERVRLLEAMIPAVDRMDVLKLERRALDAARARNGARGTNGRDRRAAAELRAVRRAERLRVTIANAAGIYLPRRLHEVRIAVKKLRYALEIGAAVVPARARTRRAPSRRRGRAAYLRTLVGAQDVLGRMHDLEVLIVRTRAVQGSSGPPDLQLSGELDGFIRRLEMECRLLHGQYMALRPALLDICVEVVAPSRRRPSAA
jgi:CHAD domain-containing protein